MSDAMMQRQETYLMLDADVLYDLEQGLTKPYTTVCVVEPYKTQQCSLG